MNNKTSLLFTSIALVIAVFSWLTYFDVKTEYPITRVVLVPLMASGLFNWGYSICCIVSCLPWFWIRSIFLIEKSDLLLIKLLSWVYWGIIFGIVIFEIFLMVFFTVSASGDYWLEEVFPIPDEILFVFPITLIATSIISFFIVVYNSKAWIMLIGNFLLACACLGGGTQVERRPSSIRRSFHVQSSRFEVDVQPLRRTDRTPNS